MKKQISILVALALFIISVVGCGTNIDADNNDLAPVETTMFRIASLKGPTTMGMVKLMNDAEAGMTLHDYDVTMYGTADEIIPMLINEEIDVALVPCNLASVLYNKTNKAVQIAAINTLGVLYIVETGENIKSISDLKGKTIVSTGKGTTPEYALNYILRQNGLEPGRDVMVEFRSEATEIAVMLSEAENVIAVLPQPYVSVVQMQNENVRIALSFTEEWDKVSPESSMVTGVLLVRKSFVEENKAAFNEFLREYQASTEYINENVSDAAKLVELYGIVPKATIAEKAIPASNIVYIDGDEMKEKISGYLAVLYEANAQSVGGALPDDDLYYQK